MKNAEDVPAGYTLGDVQTGNFKFVADSYRTFEFGTPSVDDAGNVGLNVEGSVNGRYNSDFDKLKGKFCRPPDSTWYIDASLGSQVIYIPADATFSQSGSYKYVDKYQLVTGYPLTPAGTTTTYPVSTNPNAYQEGDDAKAAGYVVGDVVTGSFKMGESNVSYPYLYNVSSALVVSEDGTIRIDSATSNNVRIGFGYSLTVDTLQTAIAGKFVQYVEQSGVSSTTSAPDTVPPFNTRGVIVFIPSDAKVTESGAQYIVSKYQPVTGYPAIPAGITIEYLGKLGDKASVQVVSYVGTGTYGSSNPNSLTFDFVPKAIMVRDNEAGIRFLEAIYGMKFAVVKYSSGDSVSMIWNKKTVSWYSAGDSYYQMNSSGTKYYAVAIG